MVGSAKRKRVVVAAACAAVVFVVAVGVGAILSSDEGRDFLRRAKALSDAKMHMETLRDGDYEGSIIEFPPDIDFDDLSMGQQIPCYSLKDGNLSRRPCDGYAIYSRGKVVALSWVFGDPIGLYGGTTMDAEGIGLVDDALKTYGTCACIADLGSLDELLIVPGGKLQLLRSEQRLSGVREPGEQTPYRATLPPRVEDVPGEVLDQIEFPPHEDPIPFKLN